MTEQIYEFLSLVQKSGGGLSIYFCAKRLSDASACVLTLEFIPSGTKLSSVRWGDLQAHAAEVFYENVSENVFFWEIDVNAAVERHQKEFGDL
jgi:hypothetical protein